jgi:Holliday junction DNA helicase RuvA
LPIREIATAIETKDAATLNRLPGIGRRMAEKVIAELHGKMTKFALSKTERPLTSAEKDKTDLYDDAVEVLMQLQYSRNDAEKMIDKALAARNDIDTVEEMINYIFSQVTAGKGPVR